MFHRIILAAGIGKRFLSKRPKALQPLASAPFIDHVLSQVKSMGEGKIIVVLGKNQQSIAARESFADSAITIVEQPSPRGTGDAVRLALAYLPDQGFASVFYVDTPLLEAEDALKLLDRMESADAPVGVICFRPSTKEHRYGRIKTQEGQRVSRIVEYSDPEYSSGSDLCNAGHMALNLEKAKAWLDQLTIDPHNGEYLLTDCIAMAVKDGQPGVYMEIDAERCFGIDDSLRLAEVEKLWQQRRSKDIMKTYGVVMTSPETVHLALDTKFHGSCHIEPHVFFGPGCTIEKDVHIKAFSYLEGVHCRQGSTIGPYSRIRPTTTIGESAAVGSFVEVKNSRLGTKVKANHLAYIGDSALGEQTNVGAGVVTCNFDGKSKHRTRIGSRVFVGSNVSLIAPIKVSDDVYIAAGSVVSVDVPADNFAIERSPIKVIPRHRKERSKSSP